jgi:glycosyltransferase involved in cell wall biosynthesis
MKTLKSVQKQTYKEWECIVVDDGSTDGTEGVVRAFAKADKRFLFYKRPSSKLKGANACRNFGFEQSKGDYINWLDSDDILHPEKIEKQVRVLKESKYSFSICQTAVWDTLRNESMGLRSDSISSSSPFDDYIRFHIFWSIQAPLWRRVTIKKFRFNESLQQSQEYDYHIRILASYADYHTTKEVLTTILSHSDNMSVSRVDTMDKFVSNLKVRYLTLKNFGNLLLPETKRYLFMYVFVFYKKMICARDFKKAYKCLEYLLRILHFMDDYKGQKLRYGLRWSLALPSFFICNKGGMFLKTLN